MLEKVVALSFLSDRGLESNVVHAPVCRQHNFCGKWERPLVPHSDPCKAEGPWDQESLLA